MTEQRTRQLPIGVAAALLSVAAVPGRLRLAAFKLAALRAAMAWLIAGVTLFLVYLQVARTSAVTSDGASNALQAWDMLHHNVLLSGWHLSDVSFYTTELPQYMLIEYLRGLNPDVIHIAGAMTYALLALLAALLAKGRATGRDAITRSVLAVAIMAAPQAGNAIFVLMGSPDHIGSTVPVLVAFLIADRAPRRWYVPVAVGAVLCWGLIADGVIVVTGVAPIVAVCLARVYSARLRHGGRWRDSWFELALAAGAAAAVWLAGVVLATLTRHGGFRIWPVPNRLAAASEVPHYLGVTLRGLLLLFGANFLGHNAGLVALLAVAHLTGIGLVAWATCSVLRGRAEPAMATQLLAASIVITLAAYLFSTRAGNLLATRDITAVLPLGAALAGRTLAGRLTSGRLLPALAVVLAAYLVSLGRVVTMPPAAPPDARLATWLTAHHLDYGLADYWDANVMTLQTAGRVRLRSVAAEGLLVTSGYWEARSDWYSPARADANFVVLAPSLPGRRAFPTVASVRRTFGQPQRIYDLDRYTIMVWNKNLLGELAAGAPPPRPASTGPGAPQGR